MFVKSSKSSNFFFKLSASLLFKKRSHYLLLQSFIFWSKSVESIWYGSDHIGNYGYDPNHSFNKQILFVLFMKIWQNFSLLLDSTFGILMFTFRAFFILIIKFTTLFPRFPHTWRSILSNSCHFITRKRAFRMIGMSTTIRK